MISIPLVENTPLGKAIFLEHCAMPLFCMEDFSVLGFAAEDVSEATRVLQEAGVRITQSSGITEIMVDNINNINQLANLFMANNVEVSYMDLADTLYQA